MTEEKYVVCGTWKIEGLAAKLILDTQRQFKNKNPRKRGYVGKQRVISVLLRELYHLKNKPVK